MLRLCSHNAGHRRFVVVVQRRALSDSASVQSTPRIISRRAWQQHLQKHPPPKASSKPKEPEKPWPKSLQIAGYAMAAIFIPYSLAWFVASNGSARAWIHSETLDDMLRHHFGEPEAHVNYYSTTAEQQEPHYQLDGEPTFVERKQQDEIASLVERDVRVRVRIDQNNEFVETVLPGTTPARATNILQAIGRENVDNDVVVAVDFGTVVEDSEEDEQLTLDDDTTSFISNQEDPVTRATNIYSLWHYISSTAQEQQDAKPSTMSSIDVDIARLEHQVSVLESDLQDVNCTRDRDDMLEELKQSKAALRTKKWKRRLGL